MREGSSRRKDGPRLEKRRDYRGEVGERKIARGG